MKSVTTTMITCLVFLSSHQIVGVRSVLRENFKSYPSNTTSITHTRITTYSRIPLYSFSSNVTKYLTRDSRSNTTLELTHRYFHKAPNREELFHETVRKLKDLTYFDCLRANKSTMAWGVEARVPFLDKDWLDLAMTLDPVHKMCGTHPDGKKIEKWALRT